MEGSRVLVAIDFGITRSSFAYVHKEDPKNVETNSSWPGREGCFTIPTALRYDESYNNVISWGYLALEDDSDDSEEQCSHLIELFKLPWLPPQLNYKKVVEDYLTQMKILIKKTLEKRWPTVKFPQHIEFIFTIPAEWPPHTARIMRECAYKAGLLTSLNSNQLEFITEHEAVALHCLNVIEKHNLQPGDSFLVADCGDETIDLVTRKLLPGNNLSGITQRVGDICGSTFVDKEFLQWIGKKVGLQALEKLKSNHYGQMQHLLHQFFCLIVKFKFSGDPTEYRTLRLNLHKYCPDLSQCATDEFKKQMDDEGWILKIDFDSVREMFDPAVNRVIKLIWNQLKSLNEKCLAMFLVGEFSENPYLIRRVKETFKYEVGIIDVPALPVVAKVRGAVAYGLNIMINERSKSDFSKSLISDEPREIIGKLGIGFNKINYKLTNLLEENQMLKQHYKNLREEHQILCMNLELKEEHQEILRVNSELREERQETLRINLELKEELQKKDEEFENFVQNLEEQKNDEIQQLKIINENLEKQKNDEIQQLKIINENLEKNLEILELVEISEDDH